VKTPVGPGYLPGCLSAQLIRATERFYDALAQLVQDQWREVRNYGVPIPAFAQTLLDADVIDWHAVAFAEAKGAEASVRDFAPKPLGAF
jgi:hypothetical protein